ncbi:MAG: SLOG family protein [Eubacteriales bacterium]|nr:SLOG family protein [Eubacteriales bacterium]
MPKKPFAVAFTGHRPESLPFGENEMDTRCFQLKTMIQQVITERALLGYTDFYCGAARGADILFGEQILLAKENGLANLRLVCVIPHEEQATHWNSTWRERYYHLLEKADGEIIISARYTRNCYYERNRYMVDHATALFSVFNGRHTGGTFYTTKYAYQQNKEIVLLDPNLMIIKMIPPRLQLGRE